MSGSQPAFKQRNDQMNMFKLLTSHLASGRDNMRQMFIPFGSKSIINRQSVSDNRCAWFNHILNEQLDGTSINRGNTTKADPPELCLGLTFDGDKNQRLSLGAAPTSALFLSSYISLIHLYAPNQSLPSTADHDETQFLQPTPSSLVASKTIGVTQIFGNHSRLLSHHQPHDVKPKTQWFTAAFKNSFSSGRTLPTAPIAMPQPPLCAPSLFLPASRTNKTIRPPDPFKVVYTVFLGRKPFQCLFKRSGIRVFCRRFHGKPYFPWLQLESISYPVYVLTEDYRQRVHFYRKMTLKKKIININIIVLW